MVQRMGPVRPRNGVQHPPRTHAQIYHQFAHQTHGVGRVAQRIYEGEPSEARGGVAQRIGTMSPALPFSYSKPLPRIRAISKRNPRLPAAKRSSLLPAREAVPPPCSPRSGPLAFRPRSGPPPSSPRSGTQPAPKSPRAASHFQQFAAANCLRPRRRCAFSDPAKTKSKNPCLSERNGDCARRNRSGALWSCGPNSRPI